MLHHSAFGFLLDTQLRLLSQDYLHAAWQRLERVLTQYELHPVDLSWGWLHAGNTRIVGIHPPAPSDYVGWTSQELARFWEYPRAPTHRRKPHRNSVWSQAATLTRWLLHQAA